MLNRKNPVEYSDNRMLHLLRCYLRGYFLRTTAKDAFAKKLFHRHKHQKRQ